MIFFLTTSWQNIYFPVECVQSSDWGQQIIVHWQFSRQVCQCFWTLLRFVQGPLGWQWVLMVHQISCNWLSAYPLCLNISYCVFTFQYSIIEKWIHIVSQCILNIFNMSDIWKFIIDNTVFYVLLLGALVYFYGDSNHRPEEWDPFLPICFYCCEPWPWVVALLLCICQRINLINENLSRNLTFNTP